MNRRGMRKGQPLGRHVGKREDREVKVHWGHDDVLRLISRVSEHWHHFTGGMRKKKFIWKDIAAEVSTDEFVVSGDDCDRKWRNLKIRYMAVLEKQILGERTSHRIDYFENMHAFLKNDPDTQAGRDNKRSIQSQMFKAVPKQTEPEEFTDISADGALEWNDNGVKMLLDLLLEFKDWFTDREEDRDDNTIWECLSEQMKIEGYEASPEQCKRKWANLAQGFQHHKAAAEATGTLPLWPFYTRVRHVMQTIGQPLLALSSMMTTSTTTTKRQIKVTRISPKKKKPKLIKQEPEQADLEELDDPVELPEMNEQPTWPDEANEQSSSSTHNIMSTNDLREICLRLERVEEHLSVTRRLDRLEAQLNNVAQQQDAQQGVNVLLTQVLSELSRLSRALMNRHGNTQDSTDLSSGITIVVPHSQHLE